MYEGYGPGGTAIIVEALTENRNRTASDVRNSFGKHNGNLGESGSVNWQFERKGLIIIDRSSIDDEETFMLQVIDSGAEDIEEEDDIFEIKVEPSDFIKVRDSLEKNNIVIKSSEIGLIPKSTIGLSIDDSKKVLKLLSALEEEDDVQNVHSNLEITEELLNEIEKEFAHYGFKYKAVEEIIDLANKWYPSEGEPYFVIEGDVIIDNRPEPEGL